MVIALFLLASGCTPGTLNTEDTGKTEDTGQTEVDTTQWQATFWSLDLGVWLETASPLDQRVRGVELDTYNEVLTAGGGEHLYEWSGAAWEVITEKEAPGPIDAFDATYGDVYIAVGDRLYTWTENPGVWARWLEQAPGAVTALVHSSYGAGHLVAVGSQLYEFTDEDTWEPWAPPAPADIQCIHGSYQRTFIGAGGSLYELLEQDWAPMDLPDAPEADVGGCTLATTYEDGEPVDHHLLVTNRVVH